MTRRRRRSRQPGESALWRRLAAGLVIALATLPALAIGGVHRPTVVIIGIVAGLALAALLLDRHVRKRPLRVGPVEAVLLLGLTLTTIQLLPLPHPIRQLLSPAGTELLDSVGHGGGWRPTTLDPPGTAYALAKGLAVVAVVLLVAHLAVRRAVRSGILWGLLASGLVVASVGACQKALGLTRIYGLYTPHWISTAGVLGTFVNNNHSAGFYLLTAILACGVALEARETERRWLAFGAAALLAGILVLTQSRGGLFGLGAGLLSLIGLLLWRAGRDREADKAEAAAAEDELLEAKEGGEPNRSAEAEAMVAGPKAHPSAPGPGASASRSAASSLVWRSSPWRSAWPATSRSCGGSRSTSAGPAVT